MADVRTTLITEDGEPLMVLRVPEEKIKSARVKGCLGVHLPYTDGSYTSDIEPIELLMLKHEPLFRNGKEVGCNLITSHPGLIPEIKRHIQSSQDETLTVRKGGVGLLSRFLRAVAR